MNVGTIVMLRKDVLLRHSRSVPAHAGYSKQQFEWRRTLEKLEGVRGVIDRVFENSNHVNVLFKNYEHDILIGIDKGELVLAPEKWYVKVHFDDGDSLCTDINGSEREINEYYLGKDFAKSDETMHKAIHVDFIKRI